jgi:chromosome partitioning protein
MSHVLSILNIKGGVGKSTIAFNLAHGIQRNDKRVLLVDLDMQCNLTDMCVAEPERITYSVYDLLTDESFLPTNAVYKTVVPEVDIIPADLRLFEVEQVINPLTNPAAMLLLRGRLAVGLHESYDYIIIDCRPEISLLTMNALIASSHYMVPVLCDRHSVRGVDMTDSYVRSARRVNPDLTEIGILINALDRRKTNSVTIYNYLRKKLGDRVMATVVGVNAAIETAATRQMTIFQFDPRQPGVKYFKQLAAEVMRKCGDQVEEPGDEQAEE